MPFVYTADGEYIALSEVVRAVPKRSGVTLVMRDGETAQTNDHAWNQALRMEVLGMCSAQPGYFVVEILTEEDGSEVVHQEPVVAWALNPDGAALPVTATGLSLDNTDVLVPDGRVVSHDGWLDDLAKWEESRRRTRS